MSKLTELLEQAGKALALRRAGCYTAHPPDYLDDFVFDMGFSLAPWLSINPEILCLLNAGTRGGSASVSQCKKMAQHLISVQTHFPLLKSKLLLHGLILKGKFVQIKFPGDCFNQVAIAVSPWEAHL